MSGRRLRPLDLHKALGADRLVAASGMIDVRWVILSDVMNNVARQALQRRERVRTRKQMGHSAALR